MNFKVSMQMTLSALRQTFNEYFPNLSLSFFSKPQEVFQSSPVKYLITDLDQTLWQIQKQALGGDIDIDEEATVAEFEEALEKSLGLHVQVMRKDGDGWDQTSAADQLSLREQNALAEQTRQSSQRIANDYADARTEWYLG